MDTLVFRLLNDIQRDFPLCARPYRAIAQALGTTETDVLHGLAALRARGAVGRIGATLAPGRLGAATLAALAVPAPRVAAVGAMVSGYAEVNHNYEREHCYNLWFVVTAPDEDRVQTVVRDIEDRAACGPALNLPMVAAFHVDLGFDLRGRPPAAPAASGPATPTRYVCSADEARVIAALPDGLALTPRPYAELGARIGLTEERVMTALRRLLGEGVIRRLGVIVSHREVGYAANAMAVWDVPDDEARACGARLAAQPGVSLAYERRRGGAAWPYNLYCMLHGTERDTVVRRAERIASECGLAARARALLFSRRRFKQCAARYMTEETHGRDRSAHRESAAG